jgi:hypothetical protein
MSGTRDPYEGSGCRIISALAGATSADRPERPHYEQGIRTMLDEFAVVEWLKAAAVEMRIVLQGEGIQAFETEYRHSRH